jgi:hypothetical protein
MAFDILDFNVDPNQRWYVKISDVGTLMRVEIYNTKADMDGAVNRVASADVAFGASVQVVDLIADTTAPSEGEPLAKFNTALGYWLILAGTDGDATKKFVIGPFTDLPAVQDALMLTEQMIQDRATVEINRGMHSTIVRNFRLGGHDPASNEGDVLQFSSSKRAQTNVLAMVADLVVEARIDNAREVQFFDQIRALEYKDFVRQ